MLSNRQLLRVGIGRKARPRPFRVDDHPLAPGKAAQWESHAVAAPDIVDSCTDPPAHAPHPRCR